jgi:hypothetical protein
MTSLLPLLLLACSGAPSEDDKTTDDTGEELGPNPIVPEEYALLWDVEASSCEDDAYGIVYYLFNGTIDDDGNLEGEEGWYWFLKADGWEGDCKDTFQVRGVEGELGWSTSPCSGCDREFLVEWELPETECGYGYESFFDDDNKDRIDDELYTGDLLLDTLSPSGNVNANMLVFAYFQDDQDEYSYIPRADSRGDYYPEEGADYASGAASLTWVISSGMCVDN